MIEGVQFLVDEPGKKKAVVLNLERHGELWEDIYDTLIAKTRKHEERVPWEDVKRRLHQKPHA